MTSGKSELLNQTSKNHKYIILLFDDETEVDDEEYFQTLPEETIFVFRKYRKAKFRSRYNLIFLILYSTSVRLERWIND